MQQPCACRPQVRPSGEAANSGHEFCQPPAEQCWAIAAFKAGDRTRGWHIPFLSCARGPSSSKRLAHLAKGQQRLLRRIPGAHAAPLRANSHGPEVARVFSSLQIFLPGLFSLNGMMELSRPGGSPGILSVYPNAHALTDQLLTTLPREVRSLGHLPW